MQYRILLNILPAILVSFSLVSNLPAQQKVPSNIEFYPAYVLDEAIQFLYPGSEENIDSFFRVEGDTVTITMSSGYYDYDTNKPVPQLRIQFNKHKTMPYFNSRKHIFPVVQIDPNGQPPVGVGYFEAMPIYDNYGKITKYKVHPRLVMSSGRDDIIFHARLGMFVQSVSMKDPEFKKLVKALVDDPDVNLECKVKPSEGCFIEFSKKSSFKDIPVYNGKGELLKAEVSLRENFDGSHSLVVRKECGPDKARYGVIGGLDKNGKLSSKFASLARSIKDNKMGLFIKEKSIQWGECTVVPSTVRPTPESHLALDEVVGASFRGLETTLR